MSFTNLKEAQHPGWGFRRVLHLPEQSDESFVANFIQEAALDRGACSSHSLLFCNLFNYFLFSLIFGIDSFFQGITNIMTRQYFLQPFYIHSMNSIIFAQKA